MPSSLCPFIEMKKVHLSFSLPAVCLLLTCLLIVYILTHLNMDQLGVGNIICAWIAWNKKLLCCPRAHGFQTRNINQVSGMEPPHIAFDECFHE